MENNQTVVRNSGAAFANPVGPWQYEGPLTIELTEKAPPEIAPTPLIEEGRKVVLPVGKLRSGVGCFMFWSEKNNFLFSVLYIYIKCVRNAAGELLWNNRNPF